MLSFSTRSGACSAIVITIAAACLMVACEQHLEPLGSADQPLLKSDTEPATEGAWAECTLPVPDETGWARLDCPDPLPDGEPRSCIVGLYENRPELVCEMTALCRYDCASDAECPQPESGDVASVCDHERCELLCDDDSVCPDGMTCHHFAGSDDDRESQGYCQYLYVCPGDARALIP